MNQKEIADWILKKYKLLLLLLPIALRPFQFGLGFPKYKLHIYLIPLLPELVLKILNLYNFNLLRTITVVTR